MKVLVCFIVLITVASCNIFSSTHHLKTLMQLEWNMVTSLRQYVLKSEERIATIKSYLEDFNNTYNDIYLKNVPFTPYEAMDNPLQAYHMIKRFYTHWKHLKTSLHEHESQRILDYLESYDNYVPKQDDVIGAATAIIRLQETYSLDISEMSNGIIKGLKSGIGLSVEELLFLGKISLHLGLYTFGMRWIQKAMDHGDTTTTSTGVDDIIYYLQKRHADADKMYALTRGIGIGSEYFRIKSDAVDAKPAQQKKVYKLGLNIGADNEEEAMKALCRGEKLRTPKDESKLNCRYHTNGHPYLFLQPLKLEQVNIEPPIVIFHHVLSDRKLQIMKEVATPRLYPSVIYDADGKRIFTVHRGSQNAWIGPVDHPVIKYLYTYIEVATGLSTNETLGNAELVQIANYGMGGHYSPHYDFLRVGSDDTAIRDFKADTGDRIATFMFYLSDVTRGGSTVFPLIGAAIAPERGSAVFWYNLHKNGTGNAYTMHAGCPVLHGSKWIANFWMREKDQLFRRPCGLNQDL